MDLTEFMIAAADAAKRQQLEYKDQVHELVTAMEREMCVMQEKHESMIHAIKLEHENTLQNAIKKMQQSKQIFEDETARLVEVEIERQCAVIEETLEAQYQSQRDKLVKGFEQILQEKDEEMQRHIESVNYQTQIDIQFHLEELKRRHQLEIDEMKKEICDAMNQEMAAESDHVIFKVVSEAKRQCNSLQDEVNCLHGKLQNKEIQLKEITEKMAELDHTFIDVAREVHARHHSEIATLSEEKLAIMHENEKLDKRLDQTKVDNAFLKEKFIQLQTKCRSFELKSVEQEDTIHALDKSKTLSMHELSGLQSCNQLLQDQINDLKSHNSSLTKAAEQKAVAVLELMVEKKQCISSATDLKAQVATKNDLINKLQSECSSLKRRYIDANKRADTLQQEKHWYKHVMDCKLQQKEARIEQLTEALDTMSKGSMNKQEPVVVHLHGNNSQRPTVDATNECHHLRSRLRELQRSNYSLEIDLMEAKRQAREQLEYGNIKDDLNSQQLHLENHSLKKIVTMMRKEMEEACPNEGSESEHVSPSYMLSIEQQLVQSRAYLDILLKSRVVGTDSRDDELSFLRLRYRELQEMLDQVREDNLRLQGLCGNDLVTYEKTDVSVLCKNQELIQKLEEALENIEDFLSEREKLITLCNNVKIALERTGASGRNIKSNSHQKCKCHHSFRKDRSGDNDKNLMGAILNDESRDDLSSDDTSPDMVACFGNGHRLTKHGYEYDVSAPTTASARATVSQRRSFRRLAEKTITRRNQERRNVRNWNNR